MVIPRNFTVVIARHIGDSASERSSFVSKLTGASDQWSLRLQASRCTGSNESARRVVLLTAPQGRRSQA
jgi:hypothetical protein